MKSPASLLCVIILLAACEPEWAEPYEIFSIPEGKHTKSFPIEMLQQESLVFEAVFDETARYTSESQENQWDVNKLLGFSDCNSHHHINSARFGWRWLNDQLEIMAYCYVDGERVVEEIGSVPLNSINQYSLRLTDEHYIFQLNDLPAVSIQRAQGCKIGTYYMLFPYFGGDEVAPHDINIKIRRSY